MGPVLRKATSCDLLQNPLFRVTIVLMVKQKGHVVKRVIVGVLFMCLLPLPAQALQSANYRFSEEAIGTGNMLQSSSNSYQAMDGVNDLAVGNAASTNYQVEAGSKTSPDPWLSFNVTTTSADFGTFSPTTTATATATFSVLNHTSYGYLVQIIGTPPTNDGHAINAMASTDQSNPGSEQFGINLVANTAPISFGANPDNGQFGSGVAGANYNNANYYRYVSGETIASAPKSSGITNYTISLIVNVAPLTPGGIYTSQQTLIVTGTY